MCFQYLSGMVVNGYIMHSNVWIKYFYVWCDELKFSNSFAIEFIDSESCGKIFPVFGQNMYALERIGRYRI